MIFCGRHPATCSTFFVAYDDWIPRTIANSVGRLRSLGLPVHLAYLSVGRCPFCDALLADTPRPAA